MSGIDFAIVGGFLLLMLVIGFQSQKHIKSGRDYSIGGKSFRTFALTCTLAATALGTSTFVGQAGDAYTHGLSSLLKVFAWSLGWLLLVGISGRFYDTGAVSIPDLMHRRLGGSVEKISGVLTLTYSVSVIAAQITGLGLVITLIFGEHVISFEAAAVIATLLTLVYTSGGGFYAVIFTDVIQSLLLMAVFGALLPAVIGRDICEAGMTAVDLRSLLGEESFRLFGGMSLLGFLSVIVKYAFSCCTNAAYIQRVAAARDRKTVYRSQIFGLVCYTVFAAVVLLSAMFGRVLYPAMEYPENILIHITVHSVPRILLGLTICGFIGAIMSTLDTQMLLSGTICVDNILIPCFRKPLTDKQHIRLMRIVTVCIGLIALVSAIRFESVLVIFEFGASVYGAGMFFPFLLTLYWKKTTRAGVMSGMILGGGSALVLQLLGVDGVIAGNVISLLSVIFVSLLDRKKRPETGC